MTFLALAFDVLARDKGASKTLDKVGDSAERAGHKGKGMGLAVAAGLATAGAVVAKFAKGSIGAFKESEEAQKKLEFAFEKFPKLADTNVDALRDLNTALAKKTKYDDDAIATGQATIAQFGLTGKQIAAVTPLLLDYADATGKDMPSAAQDLGKALLGNAKALKNVGIAYKSTGDPAKDFANIQGLLSAKVGGFAEKEGKTAAGQAAILGNQYGELQEKVGAKLVPMLAKLAEKLLQVVDFVDRNSAVIGPLAVILGGLGGTLFTIVKVTQAWTAVQAALNIVMTANPIGIVVVAIAAFVAALVIAYKKSETFRTVVQGVFKVVGGAVLTLIDAWLFAFQKFAEGMSHVPFIGDKFKGVAEGIKGVRGTIKDLKADLAGLGQKTTRVPVVIDIRTTLGKAVAQATSAKQDRNTRALGGPVRAGESYWVGEREAELFVPDVSGRILNQRQVRAASQGSGGFSHNGDIIIQKADNETDPQAVSRALSNRAFLMGFT